MSFLFFKKEDRYMLRNLIWQIFLLLTFLRFSSCKWLLKNEPVWLMHTTCDPWNVLFRIFDCFLYIAGFVFSLYSSKQCGNKEFAPLFYKMNILFPRMRTKDNIACFCRIHFFTFIVWKKKYGEFFFPQDFFFS